MRLLNAQSKLVEEFFGDDIPKYAILSHTWGKEELTFQEWSQPSTTTKTRAGYKKIISACDLVRGLNHEWLWVDTNCIDKTSSSELSEAINSMFTWYHNAEICIAYLDDVTSMGPTESNTVFGEAGVEDGGNTFLSQFRATKWFTRGWTLQELIAPPKLHFYNQQWARIGTKRGLAAEISAVTGIRKMYLCPAPHQPPKLWLTASISERMLWIAPRITTRVEDMAYCMFGLFDINMPLLYGEGPRAFIRLQEEIIRVSSDQTIFAWKKPAEIPSLVEETALAVSPRAFLDAEKYQPMMPSRGTSPYAVTNMGLSIHCPLLWTWSGFIAVLNVNMSGRCNSRAGIALISDKAGPVDSHSTMSTFRAGFAPGPLAVCYKFGAALDDMSEQTYLRLINPMSKTIPLIDTKVVTTSEKYGLWLVWNRHERLMISQLRTELPLELDFNTGILNFPTSPSDWKENVSKMEKPHKHHIRVTGGTLIYRHGSNKSTTPRDVRLFITLSAVTMMASSKTHFIFNFQAVEEPKWFSQSRNARGKLLDAEMKRILDLASHDQHIVDHQTSRIDESLSVNLGCCNVEHPSYTLLRLAHIQAAHSIGIDKSQ
jgi:hypothetical protein